MTSTDSAGWDCHVHVFDAAAPVQPGHYQPAHQPLEKIEALAQAHGRGHLVLVQPSVYGTDNSLLLDALRQQPGRHRGVVVVDTVPSDDAFDTMHALGVRGVRFNLVSPVGHGPALEPLFAALAPRLRARGWHVQWYVSAETLGTVADLHAAHPVGCVLDHLAGLRAGLPSDHSAWDAAQRLAQQGAWTKLSGWYRLQAEAPYDTLDDHLRRVAGLFDQRMVWGSDWPHTSFAPDAMPAYDSLWAPVVRALRAGRLDSIGSGAAQALYG